MVTVNDSSNVNLTNGNLTDQVKADPDNDVEIDKIQVGLQLTKLEPVHTGCIVKLYNHMSTPIGKEVIDSGWKSAGIFDALELDSKKIPLIDPFEDIDPMLSNDVEQSDDSHLLAICDVTADDNTNFEWEEADN